MLKSLTEYMNKAASVLKGSVGGHGYLYVKKFTVLLINASTLVKRKPDLRPGSPKVLSKR